MLVKPTLWTAYSLRITPPNKIWTHSDVGRKKVFLWPDFPQAMSANVLFLSSLMLWHRFVQQCDPAAGHLDAHRCEPRLDVNTIAFVVFFETWFPWRLCIAIFVYLRLLLQEHPAQCTFKRTPLKPANHRIKFCTVSAECLDFIRPNKGGVYINHYFMLSYLAANMNNCVHRNCMSWTNIDRLAPSILRI